MAQTKKKKNLKKKLLAIKGGWTTPKAGRGGLATPYGLVGHLGFLKIFFNLLLF
jgi:hypothetical protein